MSKVTKKARIEQELEQIRIANGGVLDPADVVEFARRNKRSALNTEFDWNLRDAAYQHWLSQAQQIIKVHVTMIEQPATKPRKFRIRVAAPKYTSSTRLRGRKGGSYKLTEDIMRERDERYALLCETIRRLVSIKEVALFDELQAVAKAIGAAKSAYLDEPLRAAA